MGRSAKQYKGPAGKKPKVREARKSGKTGEGGTVKGEGKKTKYDINTAAQIVHEPEVSYSSRVRAIGNSKGVILNSQVLEVSGLNPDGDILVQAGKGFITIVSAKSAPVNTDLSTWDKHFKSAIKTGMKPETDLFEGLENDFDSKGW
jgi:antitoxin component of MazEF toxin-antitoxin module